MSIFHIEQIVIVLNPEIKGCDMILHNLIILENFEKHIQLER